MDYQIKVFKKNQKGFSILEMIIVIGVAALLSGVSMSAFSNLKNHENLEIDTMNVVEAIRHVKNNAKVGKLDSNWGLKIDANSLTSFKGVDYASRDTSFDQSVNFSPSTTASGLSEIVFDNNTGITTNIGTITLSNNSSNKEIIVNEQGTVTY